MFCKTVQGIKFKTKHVGLVQSGPHHHFNKNYLVLVMIYS